MYILVQLLYSRCTAPTLVVFEGLSPPACNAVHIGFALAFGQCSKHEKAREEACDISTGSSCVVCQKVRYCRWGQTSILSWTSPSVDSVRREIAILRHLLQYLAHNGNRHGRSALVTAIRTCFATHWELRAATCQRGEVLATQKSLQVCLAFAMHLPHQVSRNLIPSCHSVLLRYTLFYYLF